MKFINILLILCNTFFFNFYLYSEEIQKKLDINNKKDINTIKNLPYDIHVQSKNYFFNDENLNITIFISKMGIPLAGKQVEITSNDIHGFFLIPNENNNDEKNPFIQTPNHILKTNKNGTIKVFFNTTGLSHQLKIKFNIINGKNQYIQHVELLPVWYFHHNTFIFISSLLTLIVIFFLTHLFIPFFRKKYHEHELTLSNFYYFLWKKNNISKKYFLYFLLSLFILYLIGFINLYPFNNVLFILNIIPISFAFFYINHPIKNIFKILVIYLFFTIAFNEYLHMYQTLIQEVNYVYILLGTVFLLFNPLLLFSMLSSLNSYQIIPILYYYTLPLIVILCYGLVYLNKTKQLNSKLFQQIKNTYIKIKNKWIRN